MFLPVALAAALGTGGCGPQTGTVSGKVVYNGTPLKGGTVVFIDGQGKPYKADIAEDGTYKVTEVALGSAKVGVETKSLLPQAGARTYAPPPGAPSGSGAYAPPDPEANKRRYVQIPDGYADPEKSGLTYTVTPGSQTYDPPLK